MGSPLVDDIVNDLVPQYMEVPHLELYNRKGDPQTHMKTFQTLFSDFSH